MSEISLGECCLLTLEEQGPAHSPRSSSDLCASIASKGQTPRASEQRRHIMDRYRRRQRPQRPQRRGDDKGPPMYTLLDKPILVIFSKGVSFAPDATNPTNAPHPLKVSGVLRGFDMFNNLVLENAVDESQPGVKTEMGEIVRSCSND